MMRNLVTLLSLCLCALASVGQTIPKNPNQVVSGMRQGKWTIMVDKDWKEVNAENLAAYYRIIDYNHGKPQGIVRDYFLSGKVQWEGQLAGEHPDVNNGLCTWFDEQGVKIKELTYKSGVLEGKAIYYYLGKKYSEGTHSNNEMNLDWVYYGNDINSLYQTAEQLMKLKDYAKAEAAYLRAKDAVIKEPYSVWLRNVYWALGYLYKDTDQPDKAATAFNDALRVHRKLDLGAEDAGDFVKFTEEMAGYFIGKQKMSLGVKLYKVAASEREKYKLFDGLAYYQDLKFIRDVSFNLGVNDSIEYYFDRMTSVLPPTDDLMPPLLNDWASFAINRKSYSNLDRIEKYCESFLNEKGKANLKDELYILTLLTYGRSLKARGQSQRALKSFADARASLEPIKESHRKLYLNAFNYSASVYNEAKKYDAIADQLFEAYEKLNESWAPQIGEQYNDGLVDLTNYYYWKGNLPKAEALVRKSLTIIEKQQGPESSDYLAMKVLLAGILEKQGRKAESQAIVGTVTKKDESKLIDKMGGDQAKKDIEDLGRYLKNNEHVRAIVLFEKSADLVSSVYIKQNDYAALVTLNAGLAYSYRETGNLKRAQELLLAANKMAQEKLKPTDDASILALWNLGEFYQITGSLQDAVFYYDKALRVLEGMTTPESIVQFYSILTRLAGVYKSLRDYDVAVDLYTMVMKYQAEKYGVDNDIYANTKKSLADVYQSKRDYATAERLYAEVEPVIRKLGENDPYYINFIESKALNHQVRGKDALVEPLFLKAKDYYARTLGTKSDRYIHVLSELAVFYHLTQAWTKADAAFSELTQGSLYQVDNFFGSLSEQEKSTFYGGIKMTFNKYNSFAIHYAEKSPAETGELYNLQLATKGLLFRSTNRVRETVLSSNDEDLKSQYSLWIQGKQYLASVYQMSDEEKKAKYVNEKEMEAKVNQAEKELTSRSEQFATLLNPRPDWREIQKKLKPGEAAIEMVRVIDAFPAFWFEYVGKGFRYDSLGAGGFARVVDVISERTPAHKAGIHEGDLIIEVNGQLTKGKSINQLVEILKPNSAKLKIRRGTTADFTLQVTADSVFSRYYDNPAIYAALILTPETITRPEMVLLNNGDDMEQRYLKYYRNAIKSKLDDAYSYNVFWKSIRARLKGTRTIYFSPDGVYNSINLNTLRNPETGKYVLDECEIKIVGNTSDLLEKPRTSDATQVVLVGFPDYNKTSSSAGVPNISSVLDFKGLKSDTSQRFMSGSTVTELPGTQVEVNTIEKIFRTGKASVSKWVAQQASEENIKSLHSPKVLHIATHGFFLSNVPAGSNERSMTGVSAWKLRENPLLRSGLLLAGAGVTINSGRDNAKDEDGILTAYEAANLDLQKTDLVVLSACETGLGQVKAGEGVYGLQRAFRSAGARSVLMSLWKVDDQSTQELMTEFYQQWQADPNRQSAFRKAQLKLRAKFTHPYYWGAFVMVGD